VPLRLAGGAFITTSPLTSEIVLLGARLVVKLGGSELSFVAFSRSIPDSIAKAHKGICWDEIHILRIVVE
jgi:hypothetical protein